MLRLGTWVLPSWVSYGLPICYNKHIIDIQFQYLNPYPEAFFQFLSQNRIYLRALITSFEIITTI